MLREGRRIMKDSREISYGVGSWEILFGIELCSWH
jgi:hypothetical protein